MRRLNQLLRQPAFHFFLFGLTLVLITWPFLAVAGETGLGNLGSYLFLLWGALVLLLFLIGRSLGEDSADRADDEEGGGPGV